MIGGFFRPVRGASETMTDRENEIADSLEDYHRRRRLGERARPEDYESKLGAAYEEFREILDAEQVLDDLIEAPITEELPRPFGDYTLLRELGRGSVGVVYEAVQRKLGRNVALKLLRTGFESDSVAREHFLREAGACAQVRHPNIVEIYDVGDVDGVPYYAMSLVEGRTLGQLCAAEDAPSPQEICRGLADVCDALQELHDRGIVHRDIKPSNIMVDAKGRMLLADFGLARTAMSETLARTGVSLGTPLYMSPEQVLGRREEIDGRTDVYCIGATLYEAIAGRPPFRTEDMQALIRMVLDEQPAPARDVAPECPVEADFIALKCLEKERRDRYQTARELRDDLLRFAAGEHVVGRPLNPMRRAVRRVRRRPRLAAAAVALVTIGVGYGVLRPSDPGQVTVHVLPDGFVRIDGGERMPSPVENLELPPGSHELFVESSGFHSKQIVLEIESGKSETQVVRLDVKDPQDPDVINRIYESMGLTRPTYEEPTEAQIVAGIAKKLAKGEPDGAAFEQNRRSDEELWEKGVGTPQPLVIPTTPRLRVIERMEGDVLPDRMQQTIVTLHQTLGDAQAEAENLRLLHLLRARVCREHELHETARQEALAACVGDRRDRVQFEALLIQRESLLKGVKTKSDRDAIMHSPLFLEISVQLAADDWPTEVKQAVLRQ